MPLGRAHPAALGEHHRHRFAGNQCGLIEGPRRGPGDDRRAARVPVALGVLQDLLADERLQPAPRGQRLLQPVPLDGQRLLLAADASLLESRQVTQFQLQDRLGLRIGESEAFPQHRFRPVLAADDHDHLVEVQECDQQAFEDMQSPADLLQPVLQAPAHGGGAEIEPFDEQRAQIADMRAAVETDDVALHAVAAFEVRSGEQVRHQGLGVDAAGTRHDHQPRRVLVVGLVAQVLDHRQFAHPHLDRDLLQHAAARDLERQRRDDDIAVIPLVARSGAHAAHARAVHGPDLIGAGDDLRLGRKIRAEDMLAEPVHVRPGVIEQAHAGTRHLAQVVRRDVGRHAHGDPGDAVEQHVRQARGQRQRFLQRTVEVRRPIHRALAEFAQQQLGERCEPRLGVAHGRKRLRVVRGPPVALPVHQRIAVGERLRHEHHRLVAGAVAVGMELADDVADGARGLLVLGGGVEAQFRHGVDDAPLHRLEAVAHMRQGAVQDHVHRVVEVRLFGEDLERDPLHPLGDVRWLRGRHLA
ncbi:hypothetical protein BMS3Abin12_00466 [bacterium BMS3Abin12]|nr:hypothetical protein BMS3Abin12_00466 [bacterium BMS3Abin12]